MSLRRLAVLATVTAIWACSDSTGAKEVRNESDLGFLRIAPGAPPLVRTTDTFWAVRGEDRELRLAHRPRAGMSDSTDFLRLRIRAGSLVSLPGGLPLSVGDSLLITVNVVDAGRVMVELQPAGLQFAPGEPAELEMIYREADKDYDNDGSVDSDDAAIEQRLRIWRQGQPGEQWIEVGGSLNIDSDAVKADLNGFSRYAVAY
jgi:hypothetical protein